MPTAQTLYTRLASAHKRQQAALDVLGQPLDMPLVQPVTELEAVTVRAERVADALEKLANPESVPADDGLPTGTEAGAVDTTGQPVATEASATKVSAELVADAELVANEKPATSRKTK